MTDNVRRAMIEAIENTPAPAFKFDQIKSCKFDVVEKFISHHKLGITISDVLGYRDMAVFGSGKKGHIIAKSFLYYSHSGNTGISTGPHLHYEIRFVQRPLDPANFINWSRKNYEEIFEKEKRVTWQSLVKAVANLTLKQP
jgi:hypothetical protein